MSFTKSSPLNKGRIKEGFFNNNWTLFMQFTIRYLNILEANLKIIKY